MSSSSSSSKSKFGVQLLKLTPLPIELTGLISDYLPKLIYGMQNVHPERYVIILNWNDTENKAELVIRHKIGRFTTFITTVDERYLIYDNNGKLFEADIFSDHEPEVMYGLGDTIGTDQNAWFFYCCPTEIYWYDRNLRSCQIIDAKMFHLHRGYATTIYYNNELYVIGGEDDDADVCESFNIITKKWKLCANMPTKRSQAICVVCNNEILVMAGQSRSGWNSIDIYSPSYDVWRTADWTLPSTSVFLYAQFISYNQQLIVSNMFDYWILDIHDPKKVWKRYTWP